MKILIVEDEPTLLHDMEQSLTKEGYRCENATSVKSAMDKVIEYEYDCIILDLMLPDGSGLKVLQQIRKKNSTCGVLILSAKSSLEDKVSGLEMGADDYLAKPFHHAELIARLHSIIRRNQFEAKDTIVFNELTIDFRDKWVKVKDQKLDLTKKEMDLLLYFMANKNRVLSKNILAEHLSGDFADMLDNHDIVYAHVKNLKKKLKDAGATDYIKNKYGTGYLWEA
jgi:DNA-binding response OmpR family regulator